ncbi:MAG: PA14 domain-containing protein [Coraliomargarita sp.]
MSVWKFANLTLISISPICAAKLSAQALLPYSTGFEPIDGFSLGSQLNNAADWTTTGTDIVISSQSFSDGAQSVEIPSASPEHIVSFSFDPLTSDVVYLDYYLQLAPSLLPVLPLLTTPETAAVLTLQPAGVNQAEWSFLNGDGLGGGVWLPSGGLVSLDAQGVAPWHRVTLRLDLTNSLWDAYVDGELFAADLAFVEPMPLNAEAFNVYGSGSGTAYLDTFSVDSVNPLFVDADLDGIDDAFELANGLDTTLDDRDLDLDSDGMTNLEEYIIGLDPQDPTDATSDLDGDGYPNLIEIELGLNPLAFSGSVDGTVLVEEWDGIGDDDVPDLTNNNRYPDSPDHIYTRNEIGIEPNRKDNFGSRIRGYLVAPATGSYTFKIAANNAGEFWLSDSESVDGASRRCYTLKYTDHLQWNKYSSQTSASISLQANQRYYFYTLQKEKEGTDNLNVAWTKPDGTFELIPASAIASFVPNDADLDGFPDDLEQAIIDADPNDGFSSLSDVNATDDFDGDTLSNFEEWQLGTSPALADSDGDGLGDGFEHSHELYDPLNVSDEDTDHDLDGYTVAMEVALGSDPDIFDSTVSGRLLVEEWDGISGVDVADLTQNSNFPDAPSVIYGVDEIDLQIDRKDNFGLRIRGYIVPPTTGNYIFWIASDDDGDFLLSESSWYPNSLVCNVNGYTSPREWNKYSSQQSEPIALQGGEPYLFEVLMKEGGGGEREEVEWR